MTLQQDAITALLERSGREGVPIRRSFTQQRQRGGGPGPLAGFVRERRRRAFDLYLLLHAAASAAPYDVTLESTVWARLLGMTSGSPAALITRQWNWLQEQQLISSKRVDKLRSVQLLREDGSGGAYTHPGVGAGNRKPEGDYFTVPHAYWTTGLQDRIDLRTKAVLMIAMSRPNDGFILPLEHASKWYGMSADSLHVGLRNLQLLNILDVDYVHTPTPLGKFPYRVEHRYTLREPLRDHRTLPAPELPADALNSSSKKAPQPPR
jgi:hypothetical protein